MAPNKYDFLREKYDKTKIENYKDYFWFCKSEVSRKLQKNEKLEYNKKTQKGNHSEIDKEVIYFDSKSIEMINFFNKSSLKDFPILFLRYSCVLYELNFNKIKNESEFKSGIYSEVELQNYLKQLISLSFAVHTEFTLASPYYSADDDKYSIFDNPLLKEKVFKVPMMRGSSWKGVVASAARVALDNDFSIENILSFGRLFGSGSEEFRKIEELAKKHDYEQKFKNKVLYYALMKFGKVSMDKLNNEKQVKALWKKIKAKELQTQRGRLVFFPGYFDKIGLEMINPHKRRTKAGTQPIYYEVVPAGAKAKFQLFYIPADNITKIQKVRKDEYNNDKKLLIEALKLIFQENEDKPQIKIGAKTKLGWGRIEPLSDENLNKMFVEVRNEQ